MYIVPYSTYSWKSAFLLQINAATLPSFLIYCNREAGTNLEPLLEDLQAGRLHEHVVGLEVRLLDALHALHVDVQDADQACAIKESLFQCFYLGSDADPDFLTPGAGTEKQPDPESEIRK
jgi:hypothetical protein